MANVINENDPKPAASPHGYARLGPRLITISQRHSRFVSAMKLVLPATAAVLIGIVLAWPGAFDDAGQAQKRSLAAQRDGGVEPLTMIKPRYNGTDGENRPFMITAKSATHDPRDQRRVTLETLQADIVLADGTGVSLTAKGGVYHQADMTLDLAGPVRIASDSGYEFRAGDVAIDIGRGTARSDAPVHGQGPIGKLKADRMRIEARGRNFIFKDNVVVTLYPGRAK